MPQNDSIELERIKKFADGGEFGEALQLINNFEGKREISLSEKISCNLLKCDILLQQGLYSNGIQLAEQTYTDSLRLENSLLTIDSLNLMANLSIYMGNTEKAMEFLRQGEELLKGLTQENLSDYKKREAMLNFLKGSVFHPIISQRSDVALALEYYDKSLTINEKYNNKSEIAMCLIAISMITGNLKGELDKGLEYIERAIILATESNRKYALGWGLTIKGGLNNLKGKNDDSIKLYKQSLSIFKELKNNNMIASVLNNLGGLYKATGDLDQALECLEQAVSLAKEYSSLRATANIYDFLIQILIDMGDTERALEHLNQLEKIHEKLSQKETLHEVLFNKALILKTSNRVINRGKAEELLKQLLEMDPIYEFKIGALINLSDLLLIELKTTQNLEVLPELKSYINQLRIIAEKSDSYSVLGENYLLEAKLALILLDLKKARRLLTQGQQVAEKFGLHALAMKISNEHDELLTHLKTWEDFKETNTSLSERMQLARLNDQIEGMVKKRVIENPEPSEETPVFLLIVSEGGTPVFSQSFIEDQTFEDHLFGGFFSAINSFISEKFSEGLERASFGEHTLLMNSIYPFLMFYVYKGQSYLAQQRIKYFIEKIKNDESIWQIINKFYQVNREIQMKDNPSLELLITEVFIEKNIELNV